MIAALLGDVHGNLPALESVLADAGRRGAEVYWDLGDCLGYGPFPDQVVARLRSLGAVSILGNYDAKVLAFPRKQEKWRCTKLPEKFLAFRFAHEALSPTNREYLAALPPQRLERVGRWRVLLTHGSPAANDEALSDDTPGERLAELAREAGADVIACGHSHRPFVRWAGAVLFANPGSVGRPEGNDPRACYGLVDFGGGRPEVELRRVEYDVEQAARAIRRAGLPDEFAEMLRRGTSLDDLRRRGDSSATDSP